MLSPRHAEELADLLQVLMLAIERDDKETSVVMIHKLADQIRVYTATDPQRSPSPGTSQIDQGASPKLAS
jgi:hypothetical protein